MSLRQYLPEAFNSTIINMSPNPFLLAADDPATLLTILSSNPAIASQQDDTGYSLLHAAASYNHHDLLRALITTYSVSPNILDSDAESPLFVCETVETAQLLLSLGASLTLQNADGQTAREKITSDDDFPDLAAWLAVEEAKLSHEDVLRESGVVADPKNMPKVPEGLKVRMGTMTEEDIGEADPAIKAYIEKLSQRRDFDTPEVQEEVRNVVRRILAGEDISDITGESSAGPLSSS